MALCLFEGMMGAESPNSFGDGAGTQGVPCPFLRNVDSSEESSSLAGVGEEYPPPGDPDHDGLYEDVNGNGRIDFADLILFMNQITWIRENQPVCCFDYNGNGNIDFADVILLFQEI